MLAKRLAKVILFGIFFLQKRRNETDEIISIFVNVFSVKTGVHSALCMTKHEIVLKEECFMYITLGLWMFALKTYICQFVIYVFLYIVKIK